MSGVLRVAYADARSRTSGNGLAIAIEVFWAEHQGDDIKGNPDGLELVMRERMEHITREGWTPKHDAEHKRGELALAGAAYAVADVQSPYVVTVPWPWEKDWWKPSSPIRNLTKAGALIVAEIDRRKAAGLL